MSHKKIKYKLRRSWLLRITILTLSNEYNYYKYHVIHKYLFYSDTFSILRKEFNF